MCYEANRKEHDQKGAGDGISICRRSRDEGRGGRGIPAIGMGVMGWPDKD